MLTSAALTADVKTLKETLERSENELDHLPQLVAHWHRVFGLSILRPYSFSIELPSSAW